MLHVLSRKLQSLTALSDADRHRIEARSWRVETFEAHRAIVSEGDDPRLVNVVLDGWACRQKQMEDGRRQIIALFVPGDMCDPCVFLLDEMSHSLASVTRVRVARIPERDMQGLLDESQSLSDAFWLEMLVASEVQRESSVSLGRRTAIERVAHLFCELLFRLRAVGLVDADSFDMPLTQVDLADLLGLSAVHVNRVLQEIRALKLIELRGRHLTVLDEPGLRALALFDPNYLHLRRHDPVKAELRIRR